MTTSPRSTPPRSCGATTASVMGRCGRDTGHEGPHRSTGETFEASWVYTPPAIPRLCEPDARHHLGGDR